MRKKDEKKEDQALKKEIAVQIGTAIACQRKKLGITQAQVAEKIGVETETISRIENGVISPTLFRLQQLAKLLDCSLVSLLQIESPSSQETAQAIAQMIDGLAAHERQMILRVVGEISATLSNSGCSDL